MKILYHSIILLVASFILSISCIKDVDPVIYNEKTEQGSVMIILDGKTDYGTILTNDTINLNYSYYGENYYSYNPLDSLTEINIYQRSGTNPESYFKLKLFYNEYTGKYNYYDSDHNKFVFYKQIGESTYINYENNLFRLINANDSSLFSFVEFNNGNFKATFHDSIASPSYYEEGGIMHITCFIDLKLPQRIK